LVLIAAAVKTALVKPVSQEPGAPIAPGIGGKPERNHAWPENCT